MIKNTLSSWSYKKLSMWEKCPYSVKLMYIDRIPQPPPDPKYDKARERGIKFHEEIATSITDGTPVPAAAKDFEEIVQQLRENNAIVEQDHFLDNQWNRWDHGWKGHWLQVKQDVVVVKPEFVLTGDWKTGKKHGNEMSHFRQMQLYSLAAWRLYPGRPEYVSELYYIDQDDIWTITFKEADLERALTDWDRKANAMFADTVFRPRPNIDTCRFCPYGPQRGNGHCPVGV